MRTLRLLALACVASIVLASCTRAQNAAFTKALKKNRGAIRVQDGTIDPELERVIFGYDFVVFIHDPKASHAIE